MFGKVKEGCFIDLMSAPTWCVLLRTLDHERCEHLARRAVVNVVQSMRLRLHKSPEITSD
jgi:hypothetical protein